MFDVRFDVQTPPIRSCPAARRSLNPAMRLFDTLSRTERELPPLTNFILPGGCALAAALHHARVVCRRAERRTVTVAHAESDNGGINPTVIHYLNRLSDLLFVLSRVANLRHGIPDIVWKS